MTTSLTIGHTDKRKVLHVFDVRVSKFVAGHVKKKQQYEKNHSKKIQCNNQNTKNSYIVIQDNYQFPQQKPQQK